MPQQKHRRHRLINVIIAALAIAIPLGIGEVALRTITRAPRLTAYRITLGDSINVRDSTLGWVTRPGAVFTVRSPEYQVVVRLDSLGMRSAHAGADGCRTLVIGDSFVAGYAVKDEQLFWAELARRTGCSVVGAGVEGWSTDQELLLLRRLLPRVRPAHVVLTFYQNDIWCNAQPVCENIGKPLFALEGDTLRLSNLPVPRTAQIPPARTDTPASIAPLLRRRASVLPSARIAQATHEPASLKVRRWLNDHSRVYRETRRMLGREEPRPSGSLTLVPLPHEFRVLHRPFDDDIAHAWRITEALLVQFAHDVRAAGAELVILHIPLRESIDRELWTATAARQGFSDAWHPDTEELELGRICSMHQLNCVFPSTNMRDAAAGGAQLYFRDDPHWTRVGHALAGRMLANALPAHQVP